MRGYNFVASDYLDEGAVNKITALILSLSKEIQCILSDKELVNKLLQTRIRSGGHFRNDFLKIRPQPTWTNVYGNKAKYYRIIIEQVRRNLLSLKQRQQIAEICAKYNYEFSQDLRDALCDHNLYPTNATVKNICKAKAMPVQEVELAQLDYTTEDKQISVVGFENGVIHSKFQVNGEWLSMDVGMPSHVAFIPEGVTRPCFYLKDDTLLVRFTVKKTIPLVETGICIGVDLGLVKPFSGAVRFADASHSNELYCSNEANRVNQKIQRLQVHKDALFQKKSHIAKLLVNNNCEKLLDKYQTLDEQYTAVRHKISNQKAHLARLVGRDVLAHAVHNNTDVVKLEQLSWIRDKEHTTWNFAKTQQAIEEKAELCGVSVVKVSAKNTSRTDPFTKQGIKANSKRQQKSSIGTQDRDYLASLEIATRQKKKPSLPLSSILRCVKSKPPIRELPSRYCATVAAMQVVTFNEVQRDFQSNAKYHELQ
ncbi:hypothetical protein B0180_09590 [Moraxella canis]|uniref:Uncharacterized protein n=2 Tax=Moraxella canis TaxID=90239 RepID=A0A1S9ZG46_9GAMM|nr:hypothetical protein B0180_09590 [Moraxella canis]